MEQILRWKEFAPARGGKVLLSKGTFYCRSYYIKHTMLITLTCLLFLCSFVTTHNNTTAAYAATAVEAGHTCNWHRVVPGDTLGEIAVSYRSTIWNLAHINHISNVNLIFVGQSLCIDQSASNRNVYTSGLLPDGSARWYAYGALSWSNKAQVSTQIRRVAARYGLPARLLLAIAWQESGWNQHVISRDGGIGVMQIMPYTAYGLNLQSRMSYNPYKLSDNIELGAIYLRSLMSGFHGNLNEVISAYNEGGWSVIHRGIFNWNYVHSVRALMYRF